MSAFHSLLIEAAERGYRAGWSHGRDRRADYQEADAVEQIVREIGGCSDHGVYPVFGCRECEAQFQPPLGEIKR